ncbi:MAG: hypothetical protein DHS20C11_08430 [Lysobacteraceae bacterium]|nr:MAG: hypothetical protein DHS20C11_08430 [Xanthomonadaceae bacterium]
MSQLIDPASLDWNKCANGLLPTIIQDSNDHAVLMLGFMNADSLARTQNDGKVWFFSRSRQTLWCKGETSGHFLLVDSIDVDCDRDTLLIKVRPIGPTCHLGTRTCFDTPAQTRDSTAN